MSSLKIASINIGGCSSSKRQNAVFNYIRASNFDIVGLQEVSFNTRANDFTVLSNKGPNNLGTALILKRDLAYSDVVKQPEGRIIRADVGDRTIINVYAPAGSAKREERAHFFREILPVYVTSAKYPVILFGDFNAVEEVADKTRKGRASALVCKALVDLISSSGLVDVWRKLKGAEKGYTFLYKGKGGTGSSRLDKFYINPTILKTVKDIQSKETTISDHKCLTIDAIFGVDKGSRIKTGLWKLNSAILKEDDFKREFQDFWDDVIIHPLKNDNIQKWWSTIFKARFKNLCIEYCRNRTKLIRETRQFYQACLEEISEEINMGLDRWEEYNNYKRCFKTWENNVMQGVLMRSRNHQNVEDEPPSTFHVRKERTNGQKSRIERIQSENGDTYSDSCSINREIGLFFKKIFQNEGHNDEVRKRVDGMFMEGLTDKSNFMDNQLTGEVISLELKSAVFSKKKNKSPGADGITYEFYQEFWPVVKETFLALVNNVLTEKQILPSQGSALIRLLPKTKKAVLVKDFRPISLLNTDYKIISSVLANRLQSTLPVVIENNQSGGVPGRRIHTNLFAYRDSIQLTADKSAKGALVSIDLEKAYDLVDRNLLWRIMQRMGYPQDFISMLRTVYSLTEMSFLNGGKIATTIQSLNGLRQGCPLSMHLFVLYIEPLLIKIEKDLEGIKVFNEKLCCRAFVDDVTVFVSSDQDISKLEIILENFCIWSNSRVNKTKSGIMGIGAWSNKRDWPIPWLQTVTTLKALGIPFETDITATEMKTWDSVKNSIIGILQDNYKRRLTIFQRISFVKSYALSKALHIAQVLACPKKIAQAINSAISKFIWGGKVERTKQGVVLQRSEKGGLDSLHVGIFFDAILAKSIFKILNGSSGPEKRMLQFWLSFPLRDTIRHLYKGNASPKAVLKIPGYLVGFVLTMKELKKDGLINGEEDSLNHKVIYNQRVKQLQCEGKLTPRLTNIDWNNVWKNSRKLPHQLREVMFMFNHDILPTMERRKRMNPRLDDKCARCKVGIESSLHAILECPTNKEVVTWLSNQLTKLGVAGNLTNLIRLDHKPNHKAALLVASFVLLMWEHSRGNRELKIDEVEERWKEERRKLEAGEKKTSY